MKLTERRTNKENQSFEIMARRMRVQRVELFSRLHRSQQELRDIFNPIAEYLGDWVEGHANPSGIRGINEKIRAAMVEMRRGINSWLLAILKDSTKMSLRHAGDSLLPIWKSNQEAGKQAEIDRVLTEAKLVFGLNTSFANKTDPRVTLTSDKWKDSQSKIVRDITKGSIKGLNPSDRIWELTRRTEADLRRMVVTGVASGQHPSVIARNVKKYVSPAKTEFAEEPGRGVYRSPFKNAMRLARTEALRAYNAASAAFAQGKDWCDGIRVNLNPAHDVTDDCDDYAGEIMEPDEFAETFPLHPHCMCFATYVINPKYLVGVEDEEA